jgi:hypothetical protein
MVSERGRSLTAQPDLLAPIHPLLVGLLARCARPLVEIVPGATASPKARTDGENKPSYERRDNT